MAIHNLVALAMRKSTVAAFGFHGSLESEKGASCRAWSYCRIRRFVCAEHMNPLESDLAHSPASSGSPAMNDRCEKRSAETFVLVLSNANGTGECASTENVSPKGARVRTVRQWKPGTRLLVKSAVNKIRTRARVVLLSTPSRCNLCRGAGTLGSHRFIGHAMTHR